MPDTPEPVVPPYGGRGPLCMGITWAEAAVALVLIALRAKTASFYRERRSFSGILGLRWDFIWVIMALLIALAAQVLMTISAKHGLGNHEMLLGDDDIVETNFWSWMAQVVAIMALAVGRIAVIAFLLTVQARANRNGRWVLYIIGFLQAAINVAEVVLILYQCSPIDKLWDQNVKGTCNLIVLCSQLGFLQGSIGVLADLVLAFYPTYLIGPLQHMKTSLKIGLCLILSGGIVAAVAGINKTIAIATITQNDITYAIAKLNTWVLTEMWFIIIFGSIPVLRPFFVRFSQQLRGTSDGDANLRAQEPRFNFGSRRPTRERPVQTSENGGSVNKPWRGDGRDDTWLQLDDRPCEYSAHTSARRPSSQFENSEHQDAGIDVLETQQSKGSTDGIMVTTETTVTTEERFYGQAL
ncbi:hypothetical protein NLG97_g965 [Lecanicillium saksenae]|uniref:Uncharacterized protein n=1 Tax=Lecanicillium saksenae TaxID=468837 RepID=A0ACC1R5P7_9HYPO|nr:hypothetical protein NLG97_g965 [Lecanicillium saksenae]